MSLTKEGDQIRVVQRNTLSRILESNIYDFVVIENGTEPMDSVYNELVSHSRNHGDVNYESIISGKPEFPLRNSEGKFDLVRIGDAVSSRNLHAAAFDALRYCANL
jgi:hypothetical protein